MKIGEQPVAQLAFPMSQTDTEQRQKTSDISFDAVIGHLEAQADLQLSEGTEKAQSPDSETADSLQAPETRADWSEPKIKNQTDPVSTLSEGERQSPAEIVIDQTGDQSNQHRTARLDLHQPETTAPLHIRPPIDTQMAEPARITPNKDQAPTNAPAARFAAVSEPENIPVLLTQEPRKPEEIKTPQAPVSPLEAAPLKTAPASLPVPDRNGAITKDLVATETVGQAAPSALLTNTARVSSEIPSTQTLEQPIPKIGLGKAKFVAHSPNKKPVTEKTLTELATSKETNSVSQVLASPSNTLFWSGAASPIDTTRPTPVPHMTALQSGQSTGSLEVPTVRSTDMETDIVASARVSEGLTPAAPLVGSSAAPTIVHANAPNLAQRVAEILVSKAGQSVEISLRPEELGSVRMILSMSETGATVVLNAERPETLDLMRRQADVLAEALKQLGHDSVDFSFGRERSTSPGTAIHAADRSGEAEESDNSLTTLSGYAIGMQDGLDLRL